MKTMGDIGLSDVQAVYSGAEGDLWKLIMGEQIHIGGFESSMDLAERAGIEPGMSGVDLCCCTGAGMRFLVRFRHVRRMTGLDATERMVNSGRQICREEGLADRITILLGDVCHSDLASNSADFVWAEDAWCYVVDKPELVAEAVRIARPGGTVCFTDWVEGPGGLSQAEADRFMEFMKFPSLEDLDGYANLLRRCGCTVLVAENTGRFAPHVDLYLRMLGTQLKYDAMKIIGFDAHRMQAMGTEMVFIHELAQANKIIQGMFIARKN